jgi:cytidine deaminase
MKMNAKKSLFDYLLLARQKAYAPYSHFQVGAVVVTTTGDIYFGANVENASFGLCMCAERNALFAACLAGVKPFEIVTIGVLADSPGPTSPCGSCRQVMLELANKETNVIMYNLKGECKEMKVADLLPYPFDPMDLPS